MSMVITAKAQPYLFPILFKDAIHVSTRHVGHTPACRLFNSKGIIMSYGDNIYDYRNDPRSKRKRNALPGEHIMNKAEGKVMRRLQNETGLTEKEIRKIKKYRVMLSKAQTEGTKAKRTELKKARDQVMKLVCQDLKLSGEHPDVKKAYVEEWNRRRESNRRRLGFNVYEYSAFRTENERK
jgi:hypothetical protein